MGVLTLNQKKRQIFSFILILTIVEIIYLLENLLIIRKEL